LVREEEDRGMTERRKKLALLAKEATARAKYDGHRSEAEQHRTKHQAEIDAVEAILEETVIAEAKNKKSFARLLTIHGSCAKKTRENGGYVLKCEQCLAFQTRLETEGFTVWVGESDEASWLPSVGQRTELRSIEGYISNTAAWY